MGARSGQQKPQPLIRLERHDPLQSCQGHSIDVASAREQRAGGFADQVPFPAGIGPRGIVADDLDGINRGEVGNLSVRFAEPWWGQLVEDAR